MRLVIVISEDNELAMFTVSTADCIRRAAYLHWQQPHYLLSRRLGTALDTMSRRLVAIVVVVEVALVYGELQMKSHRWQTDDQHHGRRCGVAAILEPSTNVITYLLTYLPIRAALSANKMSLVRLWTPQQRGGQPSSCMVSTQAFVSLSVLQWVGAVTMVTASEKMASSATQQTLLPEPEVLGRCPTLFT